MDNTHNEIRLASARRCTEELLKLPGLRCVLLTGSVAQGCADAASDVDLAVYFDAMPTREQIEEFRHSLGGGDWIFYFGDPLEGGCAISFHIDGIKHDFGMAALDSWQEWMKDILENHNHDSPLQKAASGIVDAAVLHGADTAAWLKGHVGNYPRELGRKMVEAHLSFFPAWVPLQMAWERGDVLHFQQILVEEAIRLLHILCGLNGVYHFGEFKRLPEYEAKFTRCPAQLSGRINSLFGLPASEAVAQEHALIDEVLQLVAEMLPEIDLDRQRMRLALPQQPA